MAEKKIDICVENCIHTDLIYKVLDTSVSHESLENTAEFFKIMGDTTRVRIIYFLAQSEMCVCDLACVLGMSQSSISHQLRLLKRANVVKNRRAGKVVYYSLADDHVVNLFKQAFLHVNNEACKPLEESGE